ncbi:uncharacterized protein TNCV_3988441 [Trichonephila clavipes]|nr:uncharacterized protein TNCV_3988441 [Trichonephila clavipes]
MATGSFTSPNYPSSQNEVLRDHYNSSSPLSRSGHLKTMKFSEGCKSFELCTNYSSKPASLAHIPECLGFTKQDLADDPLLVLDFLKVYEVMALVQHC